MILSENEKIALFDSGICRAGIEGISFCYISPTGLAADTTTGSVSDEPAAAAAASHENHQSSVYGDVVVNLFEEIQQQQQEKEEGQKISIDLLAQATVEKGNASLIKSALDQNNIEITLNLISLLAEKNATLAEKNASFMLLELPNDPKRTPLEIDGLAAACLANPKPSIFLSGKRDQWEYAKTNEQSYETLRESALFSARTVTKLNGSNIHFAMFQQGDSKVECIRFGFTHNPLVGVDDPSSVEGDPLEINTEFFTSLGLPPDWKVELSTHAKRLEMVQHVLNKLGSNLIDESHTQVLFEHFLSELVSSLDGDSSSSRVLNVNTNEANMTVDVNVCNEYLRQQGTTPTTSKGLVVPLVIRSDLVVINASQQEDTKSVQLIGCRYNIEMKKALTTLKHSAVREKSQLVGESLARSLSMGDTSKVVLSALCDCFCIHILVHFPGEKKAYLSHREVEPGRIVCVLAWLHMISKKNDWTLEDFQAMGLAIGSAYEDEIADAAKKRGAEGKATTSNHSDDDKSDKVKRVKKKVGKKRSAFCASNYDSGATVIDMTLIDQSEMEQERSKKMTTFSAFQNFYRFGDPLPVTEDVIRVLQEQEKLSSEETYHDRCARGGFQ